MQAGRYFALGYGPVDVELETQSGVEGLAWKTDERLGAVKAWSRLSGASGKLVPMADVSWDSLMEVLTKGEARPLRMNGSGLHQKSAQLHQAPEEVAQFWRSLTVTPKTFLLGKWMEQTKAILRRLFEAPECPKKVREQGLVLIGVTPGSVVETAPSRMRAAKKAA